MTPVRRSARPSLRLTSAFLADDALLLRPVERADLPQLAAWRNDPELRLRTREFRPLTLVDQTRWFERISGPDRRDVMFVVTVKRDARPIGVVGLCHWAPRDRTAEVSFYIGAPEARGRGYAERALRLLHGYGFQEMALDRIWAEVYAFNTPSIRVLEKLGYVKEGVLRQHVFREGRRVDSLMMGLLRPEWEAQEPSEPR